MFPSSLPACALDFRRKWRHEARKSIRVQQSNDSLLGDRPRVKYVAFGGAGVVGRFKATEDNISIPDDAPTGPFRSLSYACLSCGWGFPLTKASPRQCDGCRSMQDKAAFPAFYPAKTVQGRVVG